MDAASYGSLLSDADAVLLLNADTGTANSQVSPSDCVRENINALVATATAIRERCAPLRTRVVFTSSRAVYGEGYWECKKHGLVRLERTMQALASGNFEPRCGVCATPLGLVGTPENANLRPLSVYGSTKRAGEDLLTTILVQSNFDLRIVRYQNVYGPGQEISNPYTGVLNWFSKRLLSGEAVEIYEQGFIKRDFIFVDDAARLLFLLATAGRSKLNEPLIVNGGSGCSVALSSAAEMLKAAFQSSSDILNCDRYRLGDVLGACASTVLAKNELGFATQIPLQEGLARYVEWFKLQNR